MPSSGSSLEERARAFAVAQNFGPEALDLNRRLVAANPADAGAHTRLARCYLQAGRVDEAEAEYREALGLNPQNRIAIGGLEEIDRLKNPPALTAPARGRGASAGLRRASRVTGATGGRRVTGERESEPSGVAPTFTDPVPETFTGFGPAEFDELARCRRRDVQDRFAPRVTDLLRRVNALGSSVEMAGVREPGKRQLFRTGRADVHAAPAHWYVFNFGGRWEPQCNIGMYGGRPTGNWLRLGIGFQLNEAGADPDRATGVVHVRERFGRFQQLVASPRGSLFLGWMIKEDARPQVDAGPPMLDVREPSEAASLIAGIDPERTSWVFFGKWLRPEDSDAAAVLRDPVALVRTIDRAFTGLLPLWRALYEG